MALTQDERDRALQLFKRVQTNLTAELVAIDGKARFDYRTWDKPSGTGGGTMAVLRGEVVEKAGVNVSSVAGPAYPSIEPELAGKPYAAAGVSTICHMYNPYAPIGHMNIRLLEVGDSFWVGGGADLTPFKIFSEDTEYFHNNLKAACGRMGEGAYERFAKWCDEYFYINHRQSPRGVGGIFFDYIKGDFDKVLGFIEDVATAYIEIYPTILRRRYQTTFSPADKDGQLYWRGRYVEYNLLYDRGTKFGLQTGGFIDAIFVSLPPVVKW